MDAPGAGEPWRAPRSQPGLMCATCLALAAPAAQAGNPRSRWPHPGCAGTPPLARLGPVETILSVIQVVIAVIVIFLVLMHSGKDAGLSGAFGVGSGTGPLGGGSMVERNLNRWTVFFAVLFFLNAILLLKHPWS